MLYNSYTFIFWFLPAALVIYFLLGHWRLTRLATISLVGSSLVFYGWGSWRGILILLASIFFNYTLGHLIKRTGRRWLLVVGIVGNLSALGYFKYFDFFLRSLNEMGSWNLPLWRVLLPVGISFFTFTQIAFLVDTYKGLANDLNLWRYILFVTFFPHLIAGPIVHHKSIMSQFARPGAQLLHDQNFNAGIILFVMGLAKKVLIADTCGPWADAAFNTAGPLGCLGAWAGALSYTMQLYFDFSGYSDMAIGLALLFNVRMPENFDAPYRAASIVQFWQKWHMTLSRFLRDYLYIPLGGNRKGPARRYINLIITMLLGGLWHGANWTYVIWGGYHGTLLAANHKWQSLNRPLPMWLARALTFLAVVIGWVFFRAADFSSAWRHLSAMAAVGGLGDMRAATLPGGWNQIIILLLLLGFVNTFPTSRQWSQRQMWRPAQAWVTAGLFFVCLLCLRANFLTRGQSAFIYWQF